MNMDINSRPNRLYVDLGAIEYNIRAINQKLNPRTKVMAVVKASGYGSGAKNIVNTLMDNGVEHLAVATAEEGIELREQGIKLPIIVLTQPLEADLNNIVEYDLIPAVADEELIKNLDNISKEKDKVTRIHVEVDTGMGRIGVQIDEVVSFIIQVKAFKNIEIEGIFTHFAGSDTDEEYTKLQISRFKKVLGYLKDSGVEISLTHACNSAGIINYPEAHYDLVRPGLMIYGYYPDESLKDKIYLKPSLSLMTRVTFIKEVEAGTPISYNCTFVTKSKSKIATIPIGYADGCRRELSNKGEVIINGMRAPIIGNVCMNATMVDVTNISDVKVGDEVILFDAKKLTVEEIAHKCGTINYEIISTVGSSVPRVYLKP